MFLGLRKSKKGNTVQVDYIVHIQEIAPWPPSQSLKTLRSVVIQWQYGDSVSGLTSPVIPSIEDGRIEFNKSFKLHVTLVKDGPVKSHDGGHYHKSLLEFNLYEPRNKNVKGQHIGVVVVDLAEQGIIKTAVSFGAPFNCKRSFKNNVQSLLYVKIQPFDKLGSSSSSLESLPRDVLSDKDGKDSVSSLMNEEHGEEVEIASFTDGEEEPEKFSNCAEVNKTEVIGGDILHSEHTSKVSIIMASDEASSKEALATHESEIQVSSPADTNSRSTDPDDMPSSPCPTNTISNVETLKNTVDSSVSSAVQKSEEVITESIETFKADLVRAEENLLECCISATEDFHQPSGSTPLDNSCSDKFSLSDLTIVGKTEVHCNYTPIKISNVAVSEEQQISQLTSSTSSSPSRDEYVSGSTLSDGLKDQKLASESDSSVLNQRGLSVGGRVNSTSIIDEKNKKSVRTYAADYDDFEDKKIDVLEDSHVASRILFKKSAEKKARHASSKRHSDSSNLKIKELERRVEMLERELREIAAIEISLYSVIAEHGSSAYKVHAAARRLSRLCTYASENWPPEGRASVARSIVSGLILAARACGNDVPRLTFWLSNSIVLRTTVTPVIEGSPLSTTSNLGSHEIPASIINRSSLKWEKSDTHKTISINESNDWQDPEVFLEALQKVEAWIFSRIVESIWWQILTPRMQSGSCSEGRTKLSTGRNSFMSPKVSDEKRMHYSVELWKNAFKESSERLCPLRADGHDCGCLPMLARLVMEKCIDRLDIAMFNALLRESDDEIPGNPISDPISDSNVLPVPAGKLSFGAGAQLKNAIGTWSRWLADLFGIDDELSENENGHNDGGRGSTASPKSFYMLNALSGLLMLPKDILLDGKTRREVCPVLSESLIRRILNKFVPDEFYPDHIPDAVFEALATEDPAEDGEIMASFPCEAAPVIYHPPSTTSVMLEIGHTHDRSLLRNSSSVMRKCHTSDDELDELSSPLSSIVRIDKPETFQTEKNTSVIRYQLLREVWRHGD